MNGSKVSAVSACISCAENKERIVFVWFLLKLQYRKCVKKFMKSPDLNPKENLWAHVERNKKKAGLQKFRSTVP